MPKHILLATTGESPQVITETLYAIAKEGLRWPDEIRLITTSVGQARAQKGLLDEGHLARLCAELEQPIPIFATSHIEVVPDAKGLPVDDARSLEDHEALADFIMTRVRDLTASDEQTLHASLAGGRKTMTFYLGYAMSLFGRREDRLSHVLVSQGFESNPGFWFPTQHAEHRYLQNRQGERLDASQASVTLAPIPFIRHRQELPAILRTTAKLNEQVNFKRLVELINLGEQPDELQLCIDLPQSKIVLSDKGNNLHYEFSPNRLALAFYAVIARETLKNNATLYRPSGVFAESAGINLRNLIVRQLLSLEEQDLTEDLDAGLESLNGLFKKTTLDVLHKPLTSSWFDQRNNELSSLFKEQLTAQLSHWLTPTVIWNDDQERLAANSKVQGGGYGVPLPLANIQLIEMNQLDNIA